MDPQFGEDEDIQCQFIWQEPRKEPLGAPKESSCVETILRGPSDMMQTLEDEQEILSSSVFSLTSHLAQVEFRLRQVLKAPAEERDAMLKALEEFTSKGSFEARGTPQGSTDEPNCSECALLEKKMHHQRSKQSHFVDKLKSQLTELEGYTNSAIDECSINENKHKIEHLRDEINKSMEESCHQPLTADELRHQINCVVKQFADRQISKEEIIMKLQAHIKDMQKFIMIIKNEETNNIQLKQNDSATTSQTKTKSNEYQSKSNTTSDDLKTETINLVRKASTLIQIFTVSQFGCSSKTDMKQYENKPSVGVTHWGNLRAKLEISIDAVYNIVKRDRSTYSLIDSYDSDGDEVVINDAPLTRAVRRHLAVNLRDLLHHGLISPDSYSIVPLIGCFPMRRPSSSRSAHFWEVIKRYYEINDGEAYNSTPARKLSQSFNLDIVGGSAISNKQCLLSTIGSIMATHIPFKRSNDAQFKAFICASLNCHKLVVWLNAILKCKSLIGTYYSSISYVANTGFQDALQSLDRLTPYNFDLPVDMAVKQFQNIKDVFM